MAWPLIGSATNTAFGSGTSVTTDSSSLTILPGDVLVAVVQWEDADGGTLSVVSSDAAQALAVLTRQTDGGGDYQAFAWKQATAGSSGVSFTATWTSAVAYCFVTILQFRPSGTASVELGPSYATGTGTALSTGSISPAGPDLVVITAYKCYSSRTLSASLIGGATVDGTVQTEAFHAWTSYKAYTSAQSGLIGSLTASASVAWVGGILALKSVSGGGTVSDGTTDTQPTSDTWTAKTTAPGARTDTQPTSDAWTGKTTAPGARTDTQPTSDAWTGKTVVPASGADTQPTSDTWAGITTAPGSTADTVLTADTWDGVYVAPGGATITDVQTTSDQWSAVTAAPGATTDTQPTSDQWTGATKTPGALTETQPAVDTWAGKTTAPGPRSDTQPHADQFSAAVQTPGQLAETLTSSDSWTAVYVAPQAVPVMIVVSGQWRNVTGLQIVRSGVWADLSVQELAVRYGWR